MFIQGILIFFSSYRQVSTVKTTFDEAEALLRKQRSNRPVSPHLTIYEPGITMTLSGIHRITGVALGFAFYAYALSYVALPILGYHVDSASLAAAFGGLPLAAKLAIKGVAALPFTFHFWNGFRHLIWDTAHELTVKGVYKTGYTVVGLTAISTIALLFI